MNDIMNESDPGDISIDEDELFEEDEELTTTTDSPSASLAPPSTPKLRRHLVWTYYNVDDSKDPPVAFCSICKGAKKKKPFKNPQSSNLKKHLKCCHSRQYSEIEAWEKSQMTGKDLTRKQAEKGQQKIVFKFDKNSVHQRAIDEKLALVAAMPNCSLNFLLSKQFCDLVETLNPKYCIPASRTKLTSLIENQLEQLKIKLQAALTGAVKFAVGLDVWTTKGMTNSYLALTVHFFSPSAKRLMNLLLGLRPIVGRHSAATIKTMCDAMLAEWELKESDISRYVTDNGSNMIAAFRDLTISISREIDEDSITADDLKSSSIFLADPNIEVESDDVEEEIDRDILEYKSCKEDYNSVFSKRLPCIAHTIQLVLHSTVDRDITFNRPIQHMLEILQKFKKSVLATESWLNKCGKTVLLPARTRWNSLCIVLERVFDIQEAISQVCFEMKWSSLNEHLPALEALYGMLKLFYSITNFIQADKYETLSTDEGAQLARNLAAEINRRFDRILNAAAPNFDPTYLISTLLDPNVAWMVENDIKFTVGKRFILAMIPPPNDNPTTSISSPSVSMLPSSNNTDRDTLWKIARTYGISAAFIEIFQNLYNGSRCCVRTEDGTTDYFTIESGVRQACILSPMLFLLAIDFVNQNAIDSTQLGLEWTVNRLLADLDFAYDVALFGQTHPALRDLTGALERSAACVKLRISDQKTKTIHVGYMRTPPRITINGNQVEELQEFTYLGSVITADGDATRDVTRRIGKAFAIFQRLRSIWNSASLSLHLKLQLFSTIVLLTALYAAETWKKTVAIDRKLDAFQQRCLRRILKISYRD
uniref:BED-type domain-containing protein n=1 Tax=Plectus sambesii TaxID=2011161 RepID=A0A914WLD1_9BILA